MRAIITGAANGIGRATALLLHAAGDASLILTDRDEARLTEVKRRLNSPQVETIVADLGDQGVATALVDRCVDRFGGIDAIISNAGAVTGAPLLDLDVERFDLLFHINTRPTWLLGKAAHPYLAESHGSIVATASMSAEHPTPSLGTYSASKAALLMLVRQMALEWGPDGIRANCVSPGPTITGINEAKYADDDKRHRSESAIPLRRIGRADDIANAIAFLIGPGASQISGHDLVVDGGLGTALMALSGTGAALQDPRPA